MINKKQFKFSLCVGIFATIIYAIKLLFKHKSVFSPLMTLMLQTGYWYIIPVYLLVIFFLDSSICYLCLRVLNFGINLLRERYE